MLFSGWMGKLGDRIGNHRLLLIALLYSGCLYILCAQAQTPFNWNFTLPLWDRDRSPTTWSFCIIESFNPS